LHLRVSLLHEERIISLIQQALDCSEEGREAALILMKQAVPCILHYENLASEKIIVHVLDVGAKRFKTKAVVGTTKSKQC
jgi:hypothetical protein